MHTWRSHRRLVICHTAVTGYVNHKHLTIINGYYSNNTSNTPTLQSLHHAGDTRPSHITDIMLVVPCSHTVIQMSTANTM